MVESLRKSGRFGFDTETGGLSPLTAELRLMQFAPDSERAFLIDCRDFPSLSENESLQPVRELLEDPSVRKIGHNLKFDCKFVKHHLGCDINGLFDTMLGSKIEGCGNPALQHNLAAAMERYLGIEVDKTEQRSDWTVDVLSENQVAYAAKDVCVLHDLEDAIIKRLQRLDLMGVANLENSIVMAMAQVELNGFLLDAPMWRQQLRSVEGQAKKAASELQSVLGSGNRQTGLFGNLEIDLSSQAQVAQSLLGLGVPVPLTEKGNYTTNKDLLEPLRYEYPAVETLQTWRALNKQITSYGENILELINPETGRIHADFNQLRAPSGRMGCNNPNLQNVPKENEYRNCFKATEGNTLVIADFSQIELRVMAEYAEDKGMIASFKSGGDYHTSTAMKVFGVENAEDVTVEQRTFAKRVNFGIGYGIGPGKLARMCDMTKEQAEDLLKQYFTALSGLDKWLKVQKYRGVAQGYVRTKSNRRVKFKDFDRRDRGETGQIERLSCNIPIQGTAADIFKRALCLIHDAFKGTSGKLVNLVHDEFVAECRIDEAELIAKKMEDCMAQAGEEYVKLVPVTADAKISTIWGK